MLTHSLYQLLSGKMNESLYICQIQVASCFFLSLFIFIFFILLSYIFFLDFSFTYLVLFSVAKNKLKKKTEASKTLE